MPYASLTTVVSGTPIASASFGNQVKANFDAAFPLGVDGWTAFTPTLTQSATLTKTVNYAKYQRVGRTIFCVINLAITSAGTAGNAILVGLPVTAASSSGIVGVFRYFDSGSAIYVGTASADGGSTSVTRLFAPSSTAAFGINPAVTAASGDTVEVSITYEAAT